MRRGLGAMTRGAFAALAVIGGVAGAQAPASGAWVARAVRWQATPAAPQPIGLQGADASDYRRAAAARATDLRLELVADGDTVAARLSNAQEPDDGRWRRELVGRRQGDTLTLTETNSTRGGPLLKLRLKWTGMDYVGTLELPSGLLASRRSSGAQVPGGAPGRMAEVVPTGKRLAVTFRPAGSAP